jgi:hypothetical protein
MTARREFEHDAFARVAATVDPYAEQLRARGLRLGPLETLRDAGAEGETELRMFIYRDDQIDDVLETRIWVGDKNIVTIAELADWFDRELFALAKAPEQSA